MNDGFDVGVVVRWQDKLGVVGSIEVDGDGAVASVNFDDGDTMNFKTDSGQIVRVRFEPGDQVARNDGVIGVVLEPSTAGAYPSVRVAFPGSVASVVEMGLRPAIIDDPLERMRVGQLGTATQFNLRSVAADYWLANRYSELVSLAHARVDLLPHQVSVVHRVVSNYPHRFMLCDEVGLGKTIEAAMIIKELRARKQVSRVLILAPSGLQRQWQFELKTKFNETFAIYGRGTLRFLEEKGVENPWLDHSSIITSHSWAAWTEERRREIAAVPWDMIVVDEAHHARAQRNGNRVARTRLYTLVRDLIGRPECARRAVLLLTASPMQLEAYELYSLAEMLNPILFSSEDDFRDHIESLAGLNGLVEQLQTDTKVLKDRRTVARQLAHYLDVEVPQAEALLAREAPEQIAERLRERHRLSEVLIRNRKKVVGGFMPRHANRWEVELTEAEKRVQRLMDGIFERGFARAAVKGQNTVGFQMVILQKLLASSSRALLTSLRGRRARLLGESVDATASVEAVEAGLDEDRPSAELVRDMATTWERHTEFDEVIALLEGIEIDSKTAVLLDQLRMLFEDPEEPEAKVLIFTEFRETQEMLGAAVGEMAGVHLFHGQLSGEQKDAAIAGFRDGRGPQVLISTEAGGEGRNLQFCHILVNYDLPWNPMKVEQRIGRVDRIRQAHAVSVFNFHVKGTIEGRILEVLERRINIFEEAVGALDPILGDAEGDIRKALSLARAQRDKAIDALGQRLERNIRAARAAEEQLADLIMDAKSFSAGIAQQLSQEEAPVKEDEFERFILELLRSVGTWIGPKEEDGERPVYFHPPFSVEHPDLVNGQEARRVCFDPSASVDSEHVEYLGFGHPIIDRLVQAVISEKTDGAAAVRRTTPEMRAGWQFNWRLRIEGMRNKEFVLTVFVVDDGTQDEEQARNLLSGSRRFDAEHASGTPDTSGLDDAHDTAQRVAFAVRDEELAAAQELAAARIEIEESRTRALYERRVQAGRDRVAMCAATLSNLRESAEAARRAVIPLWEANLRRAEAEVASLRDDLERDLSALEKRRIPGAEVQLLNVARIQPDETEARVD